MSRMPMTRIARSSSQTGPHTGKPKRVVSAPGSFLVTAFSLPVCRCAVCGVSVVLSAPRRCVATKPQSPFGHRLAARSDAPSGVLRRASDVLYANFFRRNAVFITGVIGAAVVLTGAYDYSMDSLWEYNNQGVHHAAHTYQRAHIGQPSRAIPQQTVSR